MAFVRARERIGRRRRNGAAAGKAEKKTDPFLRYRVRTRALTYTYFIIGRASARVRTHTHTWAYV